MFKSSILLLFISSSLCAIEDGFVPLFDGKTLEGWTSARSTGSGDWGPFSVNEEEKAIHVYAGEEANSKQKSDCLNTNTEYSHYILKLEYKWPGKRFAPRVDWDRDAGLLFHVHGKLTKVWPFSIEMQIGESPGDKPNSKGPGSERRFHTGDLFVLGKNVRATTTKKMGYYHSEGEPISGRAVPTKLGTENPMGEWNSMEIHVHGSEKATFIFNGETVLEITDIEQKNAEGVFVPLEKGRIGLQAEWAEILYRNILIKELPQS